MSNQRNGKYSCVELERRFLVKSLPPELAGGISRWHIVDRYFPGTRLRLRKMESPTGEIKHKLTQKFSEDSQPNHRTTITNIYLNEAEYARLEALGGNEITKYRYLYNVHGFQFGIDVFAGRHEGLILAEIEAESEQELEQIAAPGFSVCEVTEDAFFTGASLSTPTALDVRNKLRELAG